MRMAGLDHHVTKIYGSKLNKKQLPVQTHQFFTFYQHPSTQQSYFLKIVELPTHLRISEAIAQRLASKYGNLITPLQIIPVDRHFQTCTYLLRAPYNVILLTTYLQIKRQCRQDIDSGFLVKFLDFLIRAWRVLETNNLGTFGINQIGINDMQQFTLCDPQLYFQKDKGCEPRLSFGQWLVAMMKDFIGLQIKGQQNESFQIQRFGQNLNNLRPLLSYLLCDSITPQFLQSTLCNIQYGCSDQNTTVTTTSSSPEFNQIVQKSQNNTSPKHAKPFCKNKVGRVLTTFIIVGVLAAIGYFCLQFFNRKVSCSEGQFLSDSKMCLSCTEGCVRCASSQPNRCMKCMVNMFLVLEDQEDKEGFCLKECRGRLIALDVCIHDKPKPVPNLSREGNLNKKSQLPIISQK